MTGAPIAKRPKLEADNLDEIAHTVWEHYRNYLDSLDQGEDQEGGGEGEIDELLELIETAKDVIPKPSPLGSEEGSEIASIVVVSPDWESRKNMLPVLLSVAYYHLADDAISQYLMMQQQQQAFSPSSYGSGGSMDIAAAMENARNLLIQSLEWYPYNAATWSMGANFGRMSKSLSLTSSRRWYEMAVRASVLLRERALKVVEDESIGSQEKEWIELLVLNQIVGVEYEGDDDEGEEEEGQENAEDQQDEEKEIGRYSYSSVESTSRFMCAMLWSMEGRHDLALTHLKPFRLTHRLHPNVWEMPHSVENSSLPASSAKPPLVFQPSGGIIPSDLYDAMTKLFAPKAAFWKESDYSSRGYYSFFHEYDAGNGKQPCNLIEEIIINHLLPRAQQCIDNMKKSDSDDSTPICGFEWWAHTRQIQANLGHNLHFDTDESMLDQEGKVTHPILSSVLYLTGGPHGDSESTSRSSSPAGATIILDETPDSATIGDTCWQGIPKDNTFLVFPGNRLHGVLPCPGNAKQEDNQSCSEASPVDVTTLIHAWEKSKPGESSPSGSDDPPHRLTFMVGFWTRNVPATMKHRRLYGPCGPLPPATKEHSWVTEIQQGYDAETREYRPVAEKIMTATALSEVSPAWEIIESGQGDDSKESEDLDEDGSYPAIPHGIDHRFFVNGAPHCFRQSLFEDREMENCVN